MGVTRNENTFNAEYLQRLRDHDPLIENHFYAYFKSRLQLKLRGRRLQGSDVQDIVQDTFMRTLKAVRDGAIRSPEAFGGYVSGVCDGVLYERYRDRTRGHKDVECIDVPDEAETLERLGYQKEKRKQVEAVLSDLPLMDRKVLRAKLFEELDNQEICARLSISRDNLRVLLHRAKSRFAKACRQRGFDFDASHWDQERAAFELAQPILQRYHELIDRSFIGTLSSRDKRELQEVEGKLQLFEAAQIPATEAVIEEHHRRLMQKLDDFTTDLHKFRASKSGIRSHVSVVRQSRING